MNLKILMEKKRKETELDPCVSFKSSTNASIKDPECTEECN